MNKKEERDLLEVGIGERAAVGRLDLVYALLDGDIKLCGEAFVVGAGVLPFVEVAIDELEEGELALRVLLKLFL